MCNTQPQSVTLQTAVLMQVKVFADNGQTFSVFDITKALRDKTSKGELEIPEVEVTGRGYRFDISHAKVKALFTELRDTGVFDPDFGLNSHFNGTYFEYSPYSVTGNATAAAPAPVTAGVAPSAPAPIFAPAAPLAKVKTAESEVKDRVKLYLDNCTTRLYQPTLKQVQSAIKRGDVSTGWTCEELQTLVEGMGYKVATDDDYQSASQVVV